MIPLVCRFRRTVLSSDGVLFPPPVQRRLDAVKQLQRQGGIHHPALRQQMFSNGFAPQQRQLPRGGLQSDVADQMQFRTGLQGASDSLRAAEEKSEKSSQENYTSNGQCSANGEPLDKETQVVFTHYVIRGESRGLHMLHNLWRSQGSYQSRITRTTGSTPPLASFSTRKLWWVSQIT